MGKKSRTKAVAASTGDQVGPRQPCPCGSGRRYKACHGGPDREIETPYVVRTFEGLAGECDWVALREFVPAGIAPLTLRAGAFEGSGDGRSVSVVSVLPGIAPALVRADGDVWLAAQVAHQSSDPSSDLAAALRLALMGEPGRSVVMAPPSGAGPRLQDVVDPGADFEVTVLPGFDFWFDGVDDTDGSAAAALEQLNSSLEPTARLASVPAAYWTSTGTREHLRWVMPYDEEPLLTALARLHVADADRLGPGSRLVGSFRAHGLLVPVWDLPVGTGAEALEQPVGAFEQRLGEALAQTDGLSSAERATRNGLLNRQLTIR